MTKKERADFVSEVTGKKIRKSYWSVTHYVIPDGSLLGMMFGCRDHDGVSRRFDIDGGFAPDNFGSCWELADEESHIAQETKEAMGNLEGCFIDDESDPIFSTPLAVDFIPLEIELDNTQVAEEVPKEEGPKQCTCSRDQLRTYDCACGAKKVGGW